MFKFLSNDSLRVVKTAKRAGRRTMSKRQKVLNLLSKGESVSWKTLRNRFDLTSPRALVDTLRSEGNMIYINTKSLSHFKNRLPGFVIGIFFRLKGTFFSL